MCIKLSLLMLYMRLFPQTIWLRRMAYVVGAVVIGFTISHFVSDLVQCVPLSALWDPTIASFHCIAFNDQIMALSSINIVTDVTIFAMPMPLVWRLNTSVSRKLQASVVLLLGAIVCIVSAVRLAYVRKFGSYDASCKSANKFAQARD